MKKARIEDLIMSRLFVPQRDLDPSDWQTHIRRNIVHEVRAETLRFYGPTDCLEAQYPGLDYSKPAHRLRLSQFPYHRRLFKVFDLLRLTDGEIQKLCKWEGTRYAREAYEASTRIKIRDTTWEGVADCSGIPTTATRIMLRGGHIVTRIGNTFDNTNFNQDQVNTEMEDTDGEDPASAEESEDEMQQSVGVELNQRLLAATEARARGENVVIDADWEQWLKEVAERGIHPGSVRPGETIPASENAIENPGLWGRDVPEYLNDDPEIVLNGASLGSNQQYLTGQISNFLSNSTRITPDVPRTGTAL